MKRLRLNRAERHWLREYCAELRRAFPDRIERLSIFGSKARGEGGRDSDLDVLVLVRGESSEVKARLRRIGYLLAAEGEAVPSIVVYSSAEWDGRARSGSVFRKSLERDEVRIL
ncbi:MAG: nucleotidyltransferase domain-containing protein [Candidatus Omnitrophica bacterium]|nr:nucleotidyltransferase domain-containing protein [Candidatus Omnitrophota bacterium]